MTPGLRPHRSRRLTMAALLVVIVAAAAAVCLFEALRRKTAPQL